jgi:hypothetical protein
MYTQHYKFLRFYPFMLQVHNYLFDLSHKHIINCHLVTPFFYMCIFWYIDFIRG